MKKFGSYYKNIEQVDCVLEIRLCEDTWEKIKRVATARESSFSWVVRYAIFRMIKRKSLHPNVSSVYESNDNFGSENKYNDRVNKRRHGSAEKHRHRLCLYGEDELFIRLSAARLGCTMTHMVRLALEKYLDSLVAAGVSFSRFRRAAWYWLGIKVHYGVEFPTIEISKVSFHFFRYQKIEYW